MNSKIKVFKTFSLGTAIVGLLTSISGFGGGTATDVVFLQSDCNPPRNVKPSCSTIAPKNDPEKYRNTCYAVFEPKKAAHKYHCTHDSCFGWTVVGELPMINGEISTSKSVKEFSLDHDVSNSVIQLSPKVGSSHVVIHSDEFPRRYHTLKDSLCSWKKYCLASGGINTKPYNAAKSAGILVGNELAEVDNLCKFNESFLKQNPVMSCALSTLTCPK